MWDTEVEELKQAASFAKQRKRVFMDRNARELWSRVYDRLSEGESGRFGAAIARAEAQVRRLALLYAMLDQSEDIRVEHLRAALALWWYCEESARVIFGGLTPLQKRLIEILLRGPRTATQIQREGLNRNVPMDKVLSGLAELSHRDLVKLEKDNSGVEKYTLTPVGAGVRLL